MDWEIKRTIKAKNTSNMLIYYNHQYWQPGEVKEVSTDEVHLVDGKLYPGYCWMEIIEDLPDLVVDVAPICSRFEILDLR